MSLSLGRTLVNTAQAGRILDRVNRFLADDFAGVEAEFARVMRAETRLAAEVGEFLLGAKSKRLRAALTLCSARACGFTGNERIQAATAIELIHLATLLHDDVIDQAQTRRNRPSVNAQWSNSVAILMADYLYCQGFRLAVACLDHRGLDLIAASTACMCEGELFQIQKEREILAIDDYFRVIKGKTANLFSTAMQLGGMLAGMDDATIAQLGQYGLNFGMAFQITDDTLDYTAQDSHWGKEVGTDIACGKQTLPLIRTLETAAPADRDFLIQSLMQLNNNGSQLDSRHDSRIDPRAVIKIVRQYDGIAYSQQRAVEFARNAAAAIDDLPESAARELLLDIAGYVSNRTY